MLSANKDGERKVKNGRQRRMLKTEDEKRDGKERRDYSLNGLNESD